MSYPIVIPTFKKLRFRKSWTCEIQVLSDPVLVLALLLICLSQKMMGRGECAENRTLNHITDKDKYPILVIDELLDDLRGAQQFFILDLRFRYHPIQVHKDDIQKTAFRSLDNHYEFFVMHLW